MKDKKITKALGLFVLGIFVVSILSVAVSAQGVQTTATPSGPAIPDYSKQISDALDALAKNANPVVKFVLGSVVVPGNFKISEGEMLVIKLLVFILMLALLYYAIDKVPFFEGKTTLTVIIAVVLSILATRYLTTAAVVNLIWAPTGALGIALTAGFPFLIFFFFIESMDNTIIRKIGWIFFMVIFLFLAIVRWDATANPAGGFNYGWIYIITCVASAVVLWRDKDIHAFFVRAAYEKIKDAGNRAKLNLIMEEVSWYTDLKGLTLGAVIPPYRGDQSRIPAVGTPCYPGSNATAATSQHAEKAIKKLEKHIKDLM
jgi:hypothetical protein